MHLAFYKGRKRLFDRLVQWYTKGPYSHCELVIDGQCYSSSLRDGGVRPKQARLNPAHWMIVDCPTWPVEASIELLEKTNGAKYDLRGALATRLPGGHDGSRWFCNEWVGYPYLPAADTFSPNHFAAVTLCAGRDVTPEFFTSRERAAQ